MTGLIENVNFVEQFTVMHRYASPNYYSFLTIWQSSGKVTTVKLHSMLNLIQEATMLSRLFKNQSKQRTLPVLAVSALVCALAFPMTASVAQADDLPQLTQLIKQNRDAVVHIAVESEGSGKTAMEGMFNLPDGQELPEEFRRFFRNMPRNTPAPDTQRSQSMGSGFIISADGYIVTNTHVVEDAKKITVTLNDKRELNATVVGQDKYSDIALLKIDATDLPTVKLGNSDGLEVGQWVVAIGAPFGLDHSATQGIVSALSRSLPDGTYVPFIQTDVAVNPGNSGGPLFDLQGNVIGVNSQIYSRSGGYMGISFAIPVNLVKNVTEQLKTAGVVDRGWLGVGIQNLDQALADSFKMKNADGALVSSVIPDSPADKAGVQAGDVIVGFNNQAVESAEHLPLLVGITKVDTEVPLTVIRAGAEKSLQVTIDKLVDKTASVDKPAMSSTGNDSLGLAVAPLTDEERDQASLADNGVMVKDVQADSPADRAGLQQGDVIIAVNNAKVGSPAELKSQVDKAPADKPLAVLIMRDDQQRFVAIARS